MRTTSWRRAIGIGAFTAAMMATGCGKGEPEAPANAPTAAPTAAAPATAQAPVAPPSEAVTDVAKMKTYDLPALKKAIVDSGAKLTVVAVWATWCAPCLEEMPHLTAFYEKHRAAGLRVLGLATDDREEMADALQRVLDRTKVAYEQGLLKPGGEAALFEGVGAEWDGQLPKTLVFDAKGEMVKLFARAVDEAALESEVAPLLGER